MQTRAKHCAAYLVGDEIILSSLSLRHEAIGISDKLSNLRQTNNHGSTSPR